MLNPDDSAKGAGDEHPVTAQDVVLAAPTGHTSGDSVRLTQALAGQG